MTLSKPNSRSMRAGRTTSMSRSPATAARTATSMLRVEAAVSSSGQEPTCRWWLQPRRRLAPSRQPSSAERAGAPERGRSSDRAARQGAGSVLDRLIQAASFNNGVDEAGGSRLGGVQQPAGQEEIHQDLPWHGPLK